MNEQNLRQVLQRLNIPVSHKTAKGWLNGSCPMSAWTHKNGSDRSPSFGVIISDMGLSSFSCYGCKSKGTLRSLALQLGSYRGVDYSEIVEEVIVTERTGRARVDFETPLVVDDRPKPLEEAEWDGMFEDPFIDPVPAGYLSKRKITPETATKIGLGYDPDDMRVVFPVRGAAGELYGFSGRSVLPNPRIKVKDYAGLPKRHLILGRERWRDGPPVVLVEGLFAYAHLHEIGFEQYANIGALLGSEMTVEKADVISGFCHATFLVLDPDEAGDAGTFGRWDKIEERHRFEEGAIGRLYGEVPVYVPDFPEDVLDVDDLTLEQAVSMIKLCKPFKPSTEQLKALRHKR